MAVGVFKTENLPASGLSNTFVPACSGCLFEGDVRTRAQYAENTLPHSKPFKIK
jgi:hypothetical protein